MCRIDDSEKCTPLVDAQLKARKDHRCMECGRTIGRGETYTNERLLFDGSVSTHKTCAHCLVARQWLSENCGGWIYTEVRDEINEHFQEGYRVAGRLAVGMNRRWQAFTGNRLLPLPSITQVSP